MKVYMVGLTTTGNFEIVNLHVQEHDDEDYAYWRYVGVFKLERAALYILLGVTNDIDLSFKMSGRFQSQNIGMKNSYPRIIDGRFVFDWLGKQIGAMV